MCPELFGHNDRESRRKRTNIRRQIFAITLFHTQGILEVEALSPDLIEFVKENRQFPLHQVIDSLERELSQI